MLDNAGMQVDIGAISGPSTKPGPAKWSSMGDGLLPARSRRGTGAREQIIQDGSIEFERDGTVQGGCGLHWRVYKMHVRADDTLGPEFLAELSRSLAMSHAQALRGSTHVHGSRADGFSQAQSAS